MKKKEKRYNMASHREKPSFFFEEDAFNLVKFQNKNGQEFSCINIINN